MRGVISDYIVLCVLVLFIPAGWGLVVGFFLTTLFIFMLATL